MRKSWKKYGLKRLPGHLIIENQARYSLRSDRDGVERHGLNEARPMFKQRSAIY